MPAQMPRGRRKTYISNRSFIVLLVLFALVAATELRSRFADDESDLGRFLAPYQGALALRDVNGGRTTHHNADGAAKRLPPMSTFNIAVALIALDSGAADGPAMALPWDGRSWPLEEWNRDHTMTTAMQVSAVWYFQELARRVGPERLGPYLKAMDYGNADLSNEKDSFLLGGSLAISAEEQVAFLTRLARGDLPLKPRTQEQVKEMLLLAKGERGVLRGKTGTRLHGQGQPDLGWFVGWLERGERLQVFALNIQGEGASGPKARQAMEAVLRELKQW